MGSCECVDAVVVRAMGEGAELVEELVLRGADHFSVIDPRTLPWQAVAHEIERIFPTQQRSIELDAAG